MFNKKLKERIEMIVERQDDFKIRFHNFVPCDECGGLFKKDKMKEVKNKFGIPLVSNYIHLKDANLTNTTYYTLGEGGNWTKNELERSYFYYCQAHKKPYDFIDENGKYYKTTPEQKVEVTKDGKIIK